MIRRVFLALASLGAAPAAVAAEVRLGDALPDGAVVIDIRSEAACLAASHATSRCLPAAWLLAADGGAPLGFHALRWLLGTVGLTGSETVVVYGGPAPDDDAYAVAAFLHIAGQSDVIVYTGPMDGTAGLSRSFSRETVFTAAIRIAALEVAAESDFRAALVAHGRTGATAARPGFAATR